MNRITFLCEVDKIKNAEDGLISSSAFKYSDVRSLLTKLVD
ncbi:hypothetical protein [Flectobacillus roseus]|nr:hypothetical protein [Flectobacillus roseus]MDI9870678.1 hypothetical protein [Flectobacillus roseus]